MHAFEILGDPVRWRILELLVDGEQTSGAITDVIRAEFGLSQPAVSQHLRVLRDSGIGGDPRALLRRVRELLRPGGTAIVETHPPGIVVRTGQARQGDGAWFSWAQVGIDVIGALAAGLSMCLKWINNQDGRWLAEIGRPR